MARDKITKADESLVFAVALKSLNLLGEELSEEQQAAIHSLVQDALLDNPTSEEGKKLRFNVIKEKVNDESSIVKSLSFGKDLHENKVVPVSILLAQLVAENIEKYHTGTGDENDALIDKLVSDIVVKMNELDFPVDYIDNCFKAFGTMGARIKDGLNGQATHHKDEILALAVGVKHPIYKTLDSRIVAFKDLDNAVTKLRESTGFTEEDYRK